MSKPIFYKNKQETAQVGDLVKIAVGFHGTDSSDVGKMAVVTDTHSTIYGRGDVNSLQLTFEGGGKSAWWTADKLEFINSNQHDIACEEVVKNKKELAHRHVTTKRCWVLMKGDKVWGETWPADGKCSASHGWTYDFSMACCTWDDEKPKDKTHLTYASNLDELRHGVWVNVVVEKQTRFVKVG